MPRPRSHRVAPCPPLTIYSSRGRGSRSYGPWGVLLVVALLFVLPAVLRSGAAESVLPANARAAEPVHFQQVRDVSAEPRVAEVEAAKTDPAAKTEPATMPAQAATVVAEPITETPAPEKARVVRAPVLAHRVVHRSRRVSRPSIGAPVTTPAIEAASPERDASVRVMMSPRSRRPL